MVLHSISTSVVLPEPTGPPTPTRSGGSFLVRPGMVWSVLMVGPLGCVDVGCEDSGTEESRVLALVLRRQDGEHGREGLPLTVGERHGVVDGRRDRVGEPGQDTLAGVLPER